MNRFIRQTILAAGPTLLLAPAAHAGIILDQPPNRAGGPASDTEFLSPGSGQPTWQLIADNMMLDEPAMVRRLLFWGFYGSDFDASPIAHDPPSGDETMRIRFYAPRPGDGLPDNGNILFEESFLNPSRSATGFTIAVGQRPLEYNYEVDLGTPFHLAANTLYWLEIAQVGDQSSHFRWENAVGAQSNLPGFAFANPATGDWRSAPGSLAFQLSAIPEPYSGVLFLLGLGIACKRRLRGGGNPLIRPTSVR